MNLIHCAEDAALTKQNLYAIYVDFSSAFNTICHDKLLQIMYDLGYPPDAIDVIRDLYTGAHTTILTEWGPTDPIPVDRGSIQGDNLSPFLFLIFMEPLLRGMHQGGRGYRFGCLTNTQNDQHQLPVAAYADDLAILCPTLSHLDAQFAKLNSYNAWAGLTANPHKMAVTAILHQDYHRGLIAPNSSPADSGH
jgi:hypothetical protein